MNSQKIKEYLIEIAKSGETISYSELIKTHSLTFNPRSSEMNNLLTKISQEVIKEEGHILILSAVVVNKKTKLPGKGFYILAEKYYPADKFTEKEFHEKIIARLKVQYGE